MSLGRDDDRRRAATADRRRIEPPSPQERFEQVYEECSGMLFAYVVRRAASVEDAADIVAETFTVAWRRIADLPSGDEARPWLYGVARHVLLNYYRSGRRQRRLGQRLEADLAGLSAALPDSAVPGPDAQLIAIAFSRLREDDQELLRLVGWEGLDRDEIAQVLGCSRANVRVRLHRARARFEHALLDVGVQRSETSGHETSRRLEVSADTKDPL